MKRVNREDQGTYSLVFPAGMSGEAKSLEEDRSWFINAVLVHVLILVIGLPSYLVYRVASPKIAYWRADRLARTAVVAMYSGNFAAAADEIERASVLSRDCLSLLRAQALYYSHFQNPQGLICWRRWMDSGQASRSDKLTFTRLAITCLRGDIARRVLKPLLLAEPTNPEILSLVSDIFALSGDSDQAISAMTDALTREPRNQSYEVRLGILEMHGRTESVRGRGKARLFGLISHLPGDRSGVARHLLLEGNLSGAEDRLLVQLLASTPSREPNLRENLIRLAVELRRNPTAVAAVLEEHLPVPRTHDVILQAGGLLSELRLHEAVLLLVPRSGAEKDRALAVLRLGALAATGKWDEMDHLLNSPDLPLPIPMRAIFKAGFAQSTGLDHEAPRMWQLAIGAAAGNPRYLEQIALRAEAWGAAEAAIQAWEQLLDYPMSSPQAARELLRLGAMWHHLPATLMALKRVIQIHPTEPRFRIQLALSQLVMEQEEDEARATLKELATGYSNDPTYCVASALSALRANSPVVAEEWISRPGIQWSNAPPLWRVIQVAALGNGFQRIRARDLARQIDVTRLSPPELELLTPWLPQPSRSR